MTTIIQFYVITCYNIGLFHVIHPDACWCLASMALWMVVGGQKTGGLQVRRGAALSSALETQRLEFGSTVREAARSHLAGLASCVFIV